MPDPAKMNRLLSETCVGTRLIAGPFSETLPITCGNSRVKMRASMGIRAAGFYKLEKKENFACIYWSFKYKTSSVRRIVWFSKQVAMRLNI